MISRILVGLGGTEFTAAAIRYAVEVAKAHEAEVLGMTVTDRRRLAAFAESGMAHDAVVVAEQLDDLEARQEESIKALRAACKEADVRVQVMRETGDPFECMISQARYHDLMVFGLRSLFDCGVVTTEPSDMLTRLVSRGVRPILAVSAKYRPVKRVLLAYSGSMESAKAIKCFVRLRMWPNASLKAVTFGEPVETEKADRLLADIESYCRAHGHDAEVEQLAGSPRQELLRHSSAWGADAIVVGNSARSLWVKKLFGETAMHVIRNAKIPVFLSQ